MYQATELVISEGSMTGTVYYLRANSVTRAVKSLLLSLKAAGKRGTVGPTGNVVYVGDRAYSVTAA